MIRSFFDTNIIVYLFDAASPEKKEIAQTVFSQEVNRGLSLLSTQVLQEFYVSVTRKLEVPLLADEAEKVVRNLARLPLIQVDSTLILSAIRRSRHNQLSFWDSLIVEAALVGGAKRLFTEDLHHGQNMDGLEIINPFL